MRSNIHFKLLAVIFTYLLCGTRNSIPDGTVYMEDYGHSFRSHNKCELINVTFCGNVEYNQTMMPNSLGHRSQLEAALTLQQYFPALKANCSSDIQFFLCSVYLPICTIMEETLLPCRSLCLSVRQGCEKTINLFGLPWPQDLNCDKFPVNSGDVACVSKNDNGVTENVGNKNHLNSIHSNQNNFVNKEYTNTKPIKPYNKDGPVPLISNGRGFSFECPDHFRVPKGYDDSLRVRNMVAKNCGLPCNGMFFTPDEIRFSRIWIGIWSIICAFSCMFTVLTFLLNTSRFCYPERPIIYLSVCYLIISVIYVFGFLSGDKVACRRPFEPLIGKSSLKMVSTIAQGTRGAICTIMFIGLYFFNMASSLWWVILTLTWFLAAGLKWGHEAIEANSQYFHLAAWAIPAIKTIIILAMGKVEGDTLTGVCYVGLWNPDMQRGFVLIPLSIYLVFGTIFLVLGFVSLFHIRTAMKHDGTKTDKLEKFMLRIGIFSVLYTVPAVTIIACLFYEQFSFDSWMVTWHRSICQPNGNNQYLIRCPSDGPNKKPNFLIFMLKYLSSLIVGIVSIVWIWSRKTVASWKELFIRLAGKEGQTYV